MPRQDAQLLGTAGTYYVMAQLAARDFHASCTFGNAPHVDVLVSARDGRKTVAVQVKTASEARRYKGRGKSKRLHELQWPLSRKVAKLNHRGLFFAFVDLKGTRLRQVPDVYVVPSAFVFAYCEPWVDDVKWVRLHITPDKLSPFLEQWDLLRQALDQV